MKILHIITGMRKAAGTSVFCGEVCNGLAAAGHDVTIAVIDPTRTDCYPIDPRVKLMSIGGLFSNIKTFKPSNLELIHIHALWSPVLHKVSNWAYRNKVPVVWSPHGMLTPWAMNNKKWKKRLAWWVYQKKDLARAGLLHATAQSEVEDIRRLGLKNRIVVAPLGVKLGPLMVRSSGAERTLLFVSRVQKKKGLINLARAWAKLPHEVKEGWKVRIVGPDQEGHTKEVRAECEKLGILTEWEFVGPKYGEELQGEYDNADLFVLPSYSENFGSVVIEALAHSIPVITTKATPWIELVEKGCGSWIEVGVEPLANAIHEALSLSDADRQAMGSRGRKLVEEKYTWDAVGKTMVKGYGAILK